MAQIPEEVRVSRIQAAPKEVLAEYKGPRVRGWQTAVSEVANKAEERLEWVAVVAERSKRSLAYFVQAFWPIAMPGVKLHWNWHLQAICDHVQGILEEWMRRQVNPDYAMKAQNLAINCPPRSLKSTIVSVCAPAWMWLRWPSWKAIFVSANPKVAVRDARACRACLESVWYQEIRAAIAAQYREGSEDRERFEWTLTGTGDLDYGTSKGGSRMAMSFLSMVTGLGGDAIFVDDPNNAKKVFSESDRANVNDTWDLALCNRVQSYTDSIRIMIMQRLHEQDLTGHWRETMPADKTCYIAIPLEFSEELEEQNRKSPFGWHDPRTKEGEILHSIRFPPDVVESERTRLGTYGFAGQMNQSPVPLEGGAFKRDFWNWCYLASPEPHHHALGPNSALQNLWQPNTPGYMGTRPKGVDMTRPAMPIPFLDVLTISVDATFGSETESASRVGLLVIGKKGPKRFVIEDRTLARSFLDTISAIKALLKDFPSVSTILIEKAANGKGVSEVLRKEFTGVVLIPANENFIARSMAMLPSVQAGDWYLLEGRPWNAAFVNEFAMFPNGKHDDRIDASSQMAAYYFGTGGGGTLDVGL